MLRPFAFLVAVLTAAPAVSAQATFAPADHAVSVSGALAGNVTYGEGMARSVSVDVTVGRVTFGLGASFESYERPVEVGVGVHLERDPAAQRATTLGASLAIAGDDGIGFLSLTHGRRLIGGAEGAVVPFATVGVVSAVQPSLSDGLAPVVGGGVSLLLGEGPVRGAVTPTMAWTGGSYKLVVVGLRAGVVIG